jgi:hypothetical protein
MGIGLLERVIAGGSAYDAETYDVVASLRFSVVVFEAEDAMLISKESKCTIEREQAEAE